MDWNTGMSWLGIGLAIFTWVASMIWHTLPRWILEALFIISIFLMLAWPMTAGLSFLRQYLKSPYGLIVAIVCGALFGGAVFGAAYYFTEPKTTEPEDKKTSNQEITIKRQDQPVVEAGYLMKPFGLPIPYEPFTTLHLIMIRQNRKAEFANFVNTQDKRVLWPTSEIITPPESIGVITISNHGSMAIFNCSYSVNFVVGSKQEPEGEVLTRLEMPLFNLRPGDSISFYVINQSSAGGIVHLSDSAIVKIQGESERRQIPVGLRALTFFDQIPLISISLHKWKGDALLEPDSWKIKGRQNKDSMDKP